MRITESQLRKVIREVIKENKQTLNEGFVSERLLPAILIVSALGHLDKLGRKVEERRIEELFAKVFEGPEGEELVELAKSAVSNDDLLEIGRNAGYGYALRSPKEQDAFIRGMHKLMNSEESDIGSQPPPAEYLGRPGPQSSGY